MICWKDVEIVFLHPFFAVTLDEMHFFVYNVEKITERGLHNESGN